MISKIVEALDYINFVLTDEAWHPNNDSLEHINNIKNILEEALDESPLSVSPKNVSEIYLLVKRDHYSNRFRGNYVILDLETQTRVGIKISRPFITKQAALVSLLYESLNTLLLVGGYQKVKINVVVDKKHIELLYRGIEEKKVLKNFIEKHLSNTSQYNFNILNTLSLRQKNNFDSFNKQLF